MRVAILLTGQLRTNKLCRFLHKNILLDKYDVDIFMSIDKTNNIQNDYVNSTKTSELIDIENAISFYRPVRYFINENYDNEYNNLMEKMKEKGIDKVTNISALRGVYQQYFVVMKAYELLINYSKENNVEYDYIIRLRFDQFIWNETEDFFSFRNNFFDDNGNILYNNENTEKLKFLSPPLKLELDYPEDNVVTVFGFGDFHHYKYVNDQFFIHNSKLIPVFYGFYDEILSIVDECAKTVYPDKGAHYEHIFYKFLIRHNIEYKRSVISGVFVREFYK
jgi:hypothetical protein